MDVNPAIKIPVAHRYPQHDELLKMLTDIFNSESLEHLLFNALMLTEENIKGGNSSGITNKFWVQHLQMQAN